MDRGVARNILNRSLPYKNVRIKRLDNRCFSSHIDGGRPEFRVRRHGTHQCVVIMANDVAEKAARLTLEAFDTLNGEFQAITRRARHRFEEKDWTGARADAVERLDAYEVALDRTAAHLDAALGPRAHEQSLWRSAKHPFARLVTDRYDLDRAETFYNSVTRKLLQTVGLNRDVEFFYLHSKSSSPPSEEQVFRRYPAAADTAAVVGRILSDLGLNAGFEDPERDARLIAQEIDLHLWPAVASGATYVIDVVKAVFYRNSEAYVIGRITTDGRVLPLLIPLVHGARGIYADAVLISPSEVSIVFSFAYSYFFVDEERYDALILFLRSILPEADLAELYSGLGYNRHGKTEFYRELHRFVHVSRELFEAAPGLEGAVMIAFTLPHFPFVFKVIKDRPCFLRSALQTSKTTTPEQIRHQYDFVSHRDHAGRMVDTQEFENLRFRLKRFSPELLEEFQRGATGAVRFTEEHVVFRFVYVQRKVLPLPLFFRMEKNPEMLRHMLIDFGYFLKDIAASGVFPCDLFNTWNYGVTHWGRVVLYDYDDVFPIERVRFRQKPLPSSELEETEPEENWIVATDEDFFVDEIDRYSGIPSPLKGVFASVHGDLFRVEFWDSLTRKLSEGALFEVIPYDRARRFAIHQ
jgi:isocitrate dehydrogenase kinase/phosphatase